MVDKRGYEQIGKRCGQGEVQEEAVKGCLYRAEMGTVGEVDDKPEVSSIGNNGH